MSENTREMRVTDIMITNYSSSISEKGRYKILGRIIVLNLTCVVNRFSNVGI